MNYLLLSFSFPVSNYMQQVPTSANIVVISCKWTQHVGPNNIALHGPQIIQ